YEWCAPGVEGHDFSTFRGVSVDAFPWSMGYFRRGETVLVERPDDLPPEAAAERGACEALTIASYVNLPLLADGAPIGWLGFDAVGAAKRWTEDELRMLLLAGNIFTGGLDRKRREEMFFRERELTQRLASLGTLVAGLAHEVNNPLNFVAGNVNYLRGLATSGLGPGGAGREAERVLAEASEGIDRIRRIVADLRAFVANRDEEHGTVDLPRVLDAALRMVSPELRHRARVACDYEGAPPVLGNAGKLGQVFLNLLLNAAQALPGGGSGDRRVRVRARPLGEARVEIVVADDGHGIAPDVLPRIFDPFFTTRGVGEGMGLGLSICHRIVTTAGGSIDVTSEPGVGTTVRVVLPRAGVRPAEGVGPDGAPGAQAVAWRVLLVGAPDLAPIVSRLLPNGEVVAAEHAGEAARALQANPAFDAVLCNLSGQAELAADVIALLRGQGPGLERRLLFSLDGPYTEAILSFLCDTPHRLVRPPVDLDALWRALAEAAAGAEPPPPDVDLLTEALAGLEVAATADAPRPHAERAERGTSPRVESDRPSPSKEVEPRGDPTSRSGELEGKG
ncbi:MAG TPA: ATP-binding protein, partial [Polyangiaceae bacterium]|nr:ATP-binding protein [Polyangiaceae bacterium]